MLTRRRFAFCLGMSLFWLSRRLGADVVDELAAAMMDATDDESDAGVTDDGQDLYEMVNGDPAKFAADGTDEGQPSAERRAHDGRPPSKWLRSLKADELRIWLKSIHVPYVGVGGMSFSVHLTRDHSFDEKRIKGLTIPEQAKLHSAAHYGY